MSENIKTINPAQAPTLERSPALGISKIGSKEFYITALQHNRGSPTQYTDKEKIGEDGKTDYFTVRIEKPIVLEFKDQGEIPIDNFFVTSSIYQQIERIPNAIEGIKNGAKFGPVKAVKRESQKSGNPYWCLAYESDSDYSGKN